ncbi:MAG TPA: NifU family protein [Planctomycetota bacterium]|nr:NifU family protein [Planctomycetota bacterium]HRR79251.1 NifU family protein [Planctomycetota bacterium]HRT94021.1 NifU family protein [Planctomycetota bacterium]
MRERVEAVLGVIRPMLQADGGDVELVNVLEDGTVQVKLKGACGGCPMSRITLKRGIEARVKKDIPEVKAVEAV